MKKLLAILLSAMLVFSMVACSNDTPSPEVVEQKPVTELDKVNDKIEAASSAFEDAEVTVDDEGNKVQSVANVPMDGYTITTGTKTVTVKGKETTELTIEYEEDGKTVEVTNTQSEQVTVNGSEDISENEQKEVAETALTEAKQISAFSFSEVSSAGSEEPSGDAVSRVYEYIPEVAAGRISRAGDVGTIKKVVITFTYNGNYASYKYDITYTWNGNDLTITEEVSKETYKKVDDVDVSDTLKEDLENEFSLSNLQPSGNKYEALNALVSLNRAGGFIFSEPEKTTNTITVRTQLGKTLASIELSAKDLYSHLDEDVINENGDTVGYKMTITEKSDMAITVNSLASELSFIPFLKAGTEITYNSTYVKESENDYLTNTYNDTYTDDYEISVVTDGKTVFSNKYDSITKRENGILTSVGSEEESEGSFSFNLGSISMSGTIEESLKEGSNDIIISKSIINELKVAEGIDLGIYTGDVICQEYSHSEDPNFEEETYILRDGEKVPFSIETLLPQIMQLLGLPEDSLQGLIDLIDGGVSVTMRASSSAPNCIIRYITPSGADGTKAVRNYISGSEYSYGLKAGAASKLMELIKGASGQEEIGISEILGYITFSGKETSELFFEEDFYGAEHIKTTETLTAFGNEPLNFAITFYDGYMKGTYNFTPEEYYKVAFPDDYPMM